MRELSIFVDESGDFGTYSSHSPFYIVSLVFHNQSDNITDNINILNRRLLQVGLPNYTIHTGPLIRKEHEYKYLDLHERRNIFNFLYGFTRSAKIMYTSILIEKRYLSEIIDLNIQITKKLSTFLFTHQSYFSMFDRIIIYYDYGQMELTNILVSVFTTILHNVEFKRISPADYKLFQASDMICTLELLEIKIEHNILNKSDLLFFKSSSKIKKDYLKAMHKKKLE